MRSAAVRLLALLLLPLAAVIAPLGSADAAPVASAIQWDGTGSISRTYPLNGGSVTTKYSFTLTKVSAGKSTLTGHIESFSGTTGNGCAQSLVSQSPAQQVETAALLEENGKLLLDLYSITGSMSATTTQTGPGCSSTPYTATFPIYTMLTAGCKTATNQLAPIPLGTIVTDGTQHTVTGSNTPASCTTGVSLAVQADLVSPGVPASPSITTASLPAAPVGKAYAATLTAVGGKTFYKWSVVSGTLPTGITLSAAGKLAGTPTTPASSTFTVQVEDSSTPKKSATKTLTIVVEPLAVTDLALPKGAIWKAYPATKLTANGGKATLVWTVIAGALPTGIKLSTAGALSGTPTSAGSSTFTVQVADGSAPKNIAARQFTIVIDPLTISTRFFLPAGLVAKAYPNTRFAANGGKATLVWTVAAGALPTGLKLSTAGVLSGTPTVVGRFEFTIRVTDGSLSKNTATEDFAITVRPMSVATTWVPNATAGKAYPSTTLKANGGKATLVWSLLPDNSLPPGLKLAAGGTISGTPTATGTYLFRVQVADGSAPKNFATRQFRIVVSNVGDPSTCDNFTGQTPDGLAYTCSFNDDFSGTTLDTTKWLAQTNFISGDKDHYACYTPNNVTVSGGNLNLVVRKETTQITCEATKIEGVTVPNKTFFSAGSVVTDKRFSQQYGRFEARIKNTASTVKGLQETFWLVPNRDYVDPTNPTIGAPYPTYGEIDVSETYSSYPNLSIPYLHHGITAQETTDTANNCTAQRGVWNTYTLTWTPTSIQIDVNGVKCLFNNTAAANDPAFKKPYILAMTALLGANDRHTNDNAWIPTTPLPATTQVDYIRAWKPLAE